MKNFVQCLLFIILALGTLFGQAEAKLVIVIDEESTVDELSLVEVQRLFLGKQSSLTNEQKAVRLGGLAKHGDRFCELVLDLQTRRFRKHWIKLVFAGHRVEPPALERNVSDLLRWMDEEPSSIAFMDKSDVPADAGLRILRIDGLLPQDDGYALP